MRVRRCLQPLLVLLCLSSSAAATVLLPLDLTELVTAAGVIVHGRVSDTRVAIIDGRTETVVTLAAMAALKGDPGAHVTFRVPGGQIGRYRTLVAGGPVLREGDEIVAFLGRHDGGVPHLVGFTQGVVRVVRQGVDGARMVLAPPSLRSPGQSRRIVRGEAPRRFVTLASFMDDVRRTTSEQAGAARQVSEAVAAASTGRR